MKSPEFVQIFIALGLIVDNCGARFPNIVFILADDLGWNDVSFHGSNQLQTPNIDLLAYSGVALGRYYSCPTCTPSRSALLSGKYAHNIGMQGYPLTMSEDRGLPVNLTTLPQYLKNVGYKTHLVGKWHLGASRNEYLPTERGFDTHFGHRGGYLDYYEYTLEETLPTGPVSGMALYRNKSAAWDVEGYITDVYTEEATLLIENHDTSSPLFLLLSHNAPHGGDDSAPLQAPPEVVRQMRHVESPARRIYAAMVKKLDDSVGEIVNALSDKEILNNTIIVFVSDNGGMTSGYTQNYASNYPLRGTKMSPFEGGVRVAGLVWSMALNNSDHYWDGYMHVSDWLPTLLSAAGVEVPENLDGVDQWENIKSNLESSRNVIYEIDDYTGYYSITHGNYKLITGNVASSVSTYQGGNLQGIIGEAPSYTEAIHKCVTYDILNSIYEKIFFNDFSIRERITLNCNASLDAMCMPDNDTLCLYNIIEDPCETKDLSDTYPDLVSTMKTLLNAETIKIIPRIVPLYKDPLSAPSLHNFTWAPWIKS